MNSRDKRNEQNTGRFSSGYDYLKHVFATNDVARATGQFLTALPIVVTSTYGLDVLYTLKTTRTENVCRPSFIFPYFASNWRLLLRGYGHTYSQACAKNMIMANGQNIHSEASRMAGGNDEHVGVSGKEGMAFARRAGITAIVSGFMAAADLFATNYWANARAVAQLGQNPEFSSAWNRLKFASLTAPTRYGALCANAGGYVAGEALMKDALYAQLPAEKYGMLSQYITTVTTGIVAGLTANGFQVVRNNQLKQYKDVSVPSGLTVARQLYRDRGASVFMRGGAVSAAYAIVAYSALGFSEYLFNEVMFPENRISRSQIANNRATLFGNRQETTTEQPQTPVPVQACSVKPR